MLGLIGLVAASLMSAEALAATAEVTRSGSTYNVTVDGAQAYSGTDYTQALLTAAGTGQRIMNVRAGGTITGTIRLRYDTTFNYFPTSERITMSVAGPGIYAYKSGGLVFNNLRIGGGPTYGIRLSSCGTPTINNLDMDFGGAATAIGLRVDNEGVAPASSVGLIIRNARVANLAAGGDRQGIETYGIDNYDIDGVSAYNIGGCGLLINGGANGKIGSVYANACGNGTTYAGLRFANGSNGATVGSVESVNCARGVFILNSQNITVNWADITNCPTDSIWIQNGINNRIVDGLVRGGKSPAITSSPGSIIDVDYYSGVGSRRFEAANFAGYYLRHFAYRGRLDANVNPLADSQFYERPALNGVTGLVSLESANFPGRYLRARSNGEIWLDPSENSSAFRNESTWRKRTGLSNTHGRSFESYAVPGQYLRHRNNLLYREAPGSLPADATFWNR